MLIISGGQLWDQWMEQGSRFSQNRNSGARPQNPIRKQMPIGEIKCWTCGKAGHYASDCKTNGHKFAFAPKVINELSPGDIGPGK